MEGVIASSTCRNLIEATCRGIKKICSKLHADKYRTEIPQIHVIFDLNTDSASYSTNLTNIA